jgi:hypothetical protein
MKRIKNIFRIAIVALFVSTVYTVSAQPPTPPSGGNNTGSNKLGGNAPIGGGLFVLLGLGAAYGGRKLYSLNRDELED